MSYRGKPSKGCESCRSRKVKCDEVKPTCGRCSKSGYNCTYRDADDLLFRNQTASAAQKAESLWRKRSKQQLRASTESPADSRDITPEAPNFIQSSSDYVPIQPQSIHQYSDALASQFGSISIGPEITADLRRLAFDRFMYDFATTTRGQEINDDTAANSLLEFLPFIYDNAAESSCLATVVDAVAITNYSARCKFPDGEAIGKKLWVKGLKLLQTALSDKEQAAKDETLASVYLMGVYDNLTATSLHRVFDAHKDGANALLQMRGLHDFYKNPVSIRLHEVSYTQMLIGSLVFIKPPLPPLKSPTITDKHKSILYSTSGIHVIQLIRNVASLHYRWHQTKTTSPASSPSRHQLSEIFREALDLECEFVAWDTATPPAMQFESKPNTVENRAGYDRKWVDLLLTGNGAPESIHVYGNIRKAWVYLFFRTAWIFLIKVIIEMASAVLALPGDAVGVVGGYPVQEGVDELMMDDVSVMYYRKVCTGHLVVLVEKICASLIGFFAMPVEGRTDEDVMGLKGYMSIWPLDVVSRALRAGIVPDSGSVANPSEGLEPVGMTTSWSDRPPQTSMFTIPLGAHAEEQQSTTPRIDVEARREWIQRVFYYLAAYLGIKKGYAMLGIDDEGALEKSRIAVEALLGKP